MHRKQYVNTRNRQRNALLIWLQLPARRDKQFWSVVQLQAWSWNIRNTPVQTSNTHTSSLHWRLTIKSSRQRWNMTRHQATSSRVRSWLLGRSSSIVQVTLCWARLVLGWVLQTAVLHLLTNQDHTTLRVTRGLEWNSRDNVIWPLINMTLSSVKWNVLHNITPTKWHIQMFSTVCRIPQKTTFRYNFRPNTFTDTSPMALKHWRWHVQKRFLYQT